MNMVFGNNDDKYKLIDGMLKAGSTWKNCPITQKPESPCSIACTHMHRHDDGPHKFVILTCTGGQIKIKLAEVRND